MYGAARKWDVTARETLAALCLLKLIHGTPFIPMARLSLCICICSFTLALLPGWQAIAATVPAGKVLVEIVESGIPRHGEWPEGTPVASETFNEDVFGLFELPQKYISTGVRADRAATSRPRTRRGISHSR